MCQCKTCEYAVCSRWARTCVCAWRRDVHPQAQMCRTGTPPAQPPSSSQHKSSCDMKPTLVTVIPCLVHIFRGGL